ncbi:MAG: hypothetical protein JNM62_09365 [Flavobacteriales bacterium]|nr:hypothetical protein [Flavobacteriales bacterium]
MSATFVNEPSRDARKWWRVADVLCWAVIAYLTWFSWHFSAERIHGDASYFLLNIVDQGSFFVNQGRWIMPLTQWMVVAGVKAGLPMTELIRLYSLGPTVLLFAVFLFVRYVLHDRAAGVAVVATQVMGLAHALFCPVFEFYAGGLLFVACLALHQNRSMSSGWRLSLFGILLFLTLSSHFLAMLVVLMTFFTIRLWRDRSFTVVAALVFVGQAVIRVAVLSDYEANALGSFIIRAERLGWLWVFHPGRLYSHGLQGLVDHFDVIMIGGVALASLVHDRNWREAGLFSGGILLLYILFSLYFPDGTHTIYREIVDHPYAIWVIVITYALVARTPHPGIAWGYVLFVALVLRLQAPWWIAGTYTERVEWMRERIQAAHTQGIERGLVLDLPTFKPPGRGAGPIAALNPMEVILLSAESGADSTVVLFPIPPEVNEEAFVNALEGKLEADHIPIIWRSASPYFRVEEAPFRVLH